MDEHDERAELIAQAADGDKSALTILLMDMDDRLQRFIAPRIPPQLGGQYEARDVVQDIHTDVIRAIGRFKGSRRGFEAWVWTIARNRWAKIFAKHQHTINERIPHVWASGDDGQKFSIIEALIGRERTPSSVAGQNEAIEELSKVVEHLREPRRRIYSLVELRGLSLPQAAAELDQEEGSARNHLYKARLDVKESMERWHRTHTD